ncbi:NUDIX domain-containing protein [Egibacter rhizosphaerae]|uniref:NUDIX domain-containing protein n=1 Tax=Egibacter rhizosphaerae TaxID=1670831 RepID=UPI0013F16F62|nr:NUDIX domain-containing protein [Egibacter rhizosphaerae]
MTELRAVDDPAATPQQLASLLERWNPTDEREASALERFRTALATLTRPFDREADPVHVTASGLVIGPRGVLLHRHKRTGAWMQPGGHIDHGEVPSQAAARETTEETGVTVTHPSGGPRPVHLDVHDVVVTGHVHLDLRYLLVADAGSSDEPAPPPDESPEVAWFSWDQAIAMADPGLIGALRLLRPA